MQVLRDYLNSLERIAQEDFARACNTSVGYLRKACSTGQRLGADLCIEIERESGRRVTVEQLRPDVDWAYLRATDCEVKVGASATATETHQEAA